MQVKSLTQFQESFTNAITVLKTYDFSPIIKLVMKEFTTRRSDIRNFIRPIHSTRLHSSHQQRFKTFNYFSNGNASLHSILEDNRKCIISQFSINRTPLSPTLHLGWLNVQIRLMKSLPLHQGVYKKYIIIATEG